MINHYVKCYPERQSFSSPTESTLYMLIKEGELVTEATIIDRFTIYLTQKPNEARDVCRNIKEIPGYIKVLLQKGYLKEIPAKFLQRLVESIK